MLESRQVSKHTAWRDPNKNSSSKEYRNLSQAPVKAKGAFTEGTDPEKSSRAQSIANANNDIFNKSMKKNIKLKISNKKYSNSPIKLDKNLKNIENRILQKIKNKRDNKLPLTKMPSIERNQSPSISLGSDFDMNKLTLSKVQDYNSKTTSKKLKNKENDLDQDLYKNNDMNSIRQNLASAFPSNDADSMVNRINYVKPNRDSQSEYDLYNSYGSSAGFSDEKRLSDRMKYKIKASFRYRDEIETADSDSFFSSKFSKFGAQNNVDGQGIIKPNKSMMNEIIKARQQVEEKKPINFPSITKSVPGINAPFSLPSLKK